MEQLAGLATSQVLPVWYPHQVDYAVVEFSDRIIGFVVLVFDGTPDELDAKGDSSFLWYALCTRTRWMA